MKALILALLLAGASARPLAHQLDGYTFDNYKKDFRKVYSAAEHDMRLGLFERQMNEVRAHNADLSQSYKKGINHLSDRTQAELKGLRGVELNPQTHNLAAANKWTATAGIAVPTELDYRTANPRVLTSVKDQGGCGSCWAHAATEGVESAYAMLTGDLFVLSQQQIISCAPDPNQCGGNGGCTGGTAEVAWTFTTANGGLTEEWMYSYASYFNVNPPCNTNMTETMPVVKTSGYSITSPRNDPPSVMQSLATNGPLAITVDASLWNNYESGIFNGCDYAYNNMSMDHAVQLVGYGTDEALGQDYWIVRNSWSAIWGERGFIRLIRESGAPKCGWTGNGGGCNNSPITVWTCGQCAVLYDTAFPHVLP